MHEIEVMLISGACNQHTEEDDNRSIEDFGGPAAGLATAALPTRGGILAL